MIITIFILDKNVAILLFYQSWWSFSVFIFIVHCSSSSFVLVFCLLVADSAICQSVFNISELTIESKVQIERYITKAQHTRQKFEKYILKVCWRAAGAGSCYKYVTALSTKLSTLLFERRNTTISNDTLILFDCSVLFE